MILALPLFPFLMFEDPSLRPSDAEPIIYRIPSENAGPPLASAEICFGKIESVSIGSPNTFGSVTVSITLNAVGTRELAKATVPNVGKQLEFVQGENVLISANINEPLLGGSFSISGADTIEDAEQLRQALLGKCTNSKDETV